MLREHRFDGLIRRLESRYPGHRSLVEEAALEAVARVVRQIEANDISNLSAYMYKVADTYVRGELRMRVNREASLEELAESANDFDPPAALAHDETPDELSGRTGEDLLAGLKAMTATWNDNIRVVTNLVLEHTFKDDYDWMTAEDLAQEATAILGEKVSPQTATMWKSRGLGRLRERFDFD